MQSFYKYYEVIGTIMGTDSTTDVLFGSFDRSDCAYELEAERVSWRAEGYKALKITSRMTTETPDPEIYGV